MVNQLANRENSMLTVKKNSFFFQPKLTINQPNDVYEQEADAVADKVMRMPETSVTLIDNKPFFGPATFNVHKADTLKEEPLKKENKEEEAEEILPEVQAQLSFDGLTPPPDDKKANDAVTIQRKCAHCEEEEKKMQRKEINNDITPADASTENYISSLNGRGRPLTIEERKFFEPRMEYDFSNVQLHTNRDANQSAKSINALAYTYGDNIVFGSNQYQPDTNEGKKLIAHELTHVVQQSTSLHRKMIQRQSPAVSATVFHPGVNHNHTPSGRWADIQANPNSGFLAGQACKRFSPAEVVGIAISREFGDKPLALQHLNWYLSTGGGADFKEDAHLDRMLRTDSKVQALLSGLIPASASTGSSFRGNVKVKQSDYQNQDFRFAFGAIDILDFEVDFASGTVHAWFQDRYEWHPVYPGLYTEFPDDEARETNCVHAALVELKSGTARDFWMKGEATVPLSLFRRPAGGSSGGSTL